MKSPEELDEFLTPFVLTLGHMCIALRNEGNYVKALDIFSEVMEGDTLNFPAVVHETMFIYDYLVHGKYYMALKANKNMKGEPNAFTYTSLITGLSGDEKMLGEATNILKDMIKKGMKPNPAAWVNLAQGYIRAGRGEEGLRIMSKIEKLGNFPDV